MSQVHLDSYLESPLTPDAPAHLLLLSCTPSFAPHLFISSLLSLLTSIRGRDSCLPYCALPSSV